MPQTNLLAGKDFSEMGKYLVGYGICTNMLHCENKVKNTNISWAGIYNLRTKMIFELTANEKLSTNSYTAMKSK